MKFSAIDKKALEEIILEKEKEELDPTAYTYEGPYADILVENKSCKITEKVIGSWLWIRVYITTRFTEKWYSRAGSERTTTTLRLIYDWIGSYKALAKILKRLEELDKWALLSTRYKWRQWNDTGDYLHQKCEGNWVEDVLEDGKVKLNVASNITKKTRHIVYQGYNPVGEYDIELEKCEEKIEYIDLNKLN